MKIKQLELFTNKLSEEREFYVKTLGFELIEESQIHFSLKIGWSVLKFVLSENAHIYHYCFLIPSNKLNEALEWINHRTETIDIEKGEKIVHFETWNAHSFYFFDASGNIAEFIVRHDLKNEQSAPFDLKQVICVNEIGIGTNRVAEHLAQLEKALGTKFWKGDLERFATNGSLEGLFLLPNYDIKENWFPTELRIKPEPFKAIIENDEKLFEVLYLDGKITTKRNLAFKR